MPYSPADLHEIEAEIMDLKRLLSETQRKMQLQESRLDALMMENQRITALIAGLRT